MFCQLRLPAAAFGLLAFATFATQVQAAIVTGDKIKIERDTGGTISSTVYDISKTRGNTGQGSGGGEFRITDLTLIGSEVADVFKTFCVERNETIGLPGEYFVSIDEGAIKGGISGGNPDPIGNATAWLYGVYRGSGLDNETTTLSHVFDYNSNADVGALQAAIWHLEGELASVSGYAAELVHLAQSADYDPDGDGFNDYNVQVMNLWDTQAQAIARDGSLGAGNGWRQSQLIIVDGRSNLPVPEPATILVWSGMVGVGLAFGFRRVRGK